MRKQDDEPMFTRWDMFFFGICVGSVVGNLLLYLLIDFFM